MRNQHAANAYTLLTAVVLVQSAHMVEHVAQVIQKFVLGRKDAHGLLGAIFDLESVHFLYNGALEAALIVALAWVLRSGLPAPVALRAVVGIQGYHVVEHSVKMFHHVFHGVAAPKGILGMFVPVIWLHFWFNLIVLGLMLWAWWAFPRIMWQPERSR
jgi:hypothetical protein